MAYCSDDDVFTLGLAAQAFVVRARPVQSADVDTTTGTIRLKAHGLTADDVVTFEVTGGGALPAGVSAFAPYYPIVVSFDLLQVAAAAGGPGLALNPAGSGWGIAIDPLRRIRRHAEETKAEIDQHLTAHGVSIEPDPVTGEYPQFLRGLNARMAARAAVTSLQIENAAYKVAVDRLFARQEFDEKMLESFAQGWPLKGVTDSSSSTSDNAARAATTRCALDWSTGRL